MFTCSRKLEDEREEMEGGCEGWSDDEGIEEEEETSDEEEDFYCPVCGHNFLAEETLEQHRKKEQHWG